MLRAAAALILLVAGPVLAEPPPSRPPVDAPERAALGAYGVGVRSLTLTQPDQIDPLAFDPATGKAPLRPRNLPVEIWYPATTRAGDKPATYSASLPGQPPGPPVAFTIAGLAVRGAPAAQGRFPIVIISHGYSNAPEAMSWLGENLASKGYVAVAIHHADPDISDRKGFPQPVMRRPLDIAFVARQTQALARAGEPGLAAGDPERLALIGYSMGGYGVLTAAGAELDPKGPLVQAVPGGLMAPYARGGAKAADLLAPPVKAVVAIAPAGVRFGAWGEGMAALRAPLLVIGGDRDATVGYPDGIAPVFDGATGAERYLLRFHDAGHAIGMSGAPAQMRTALWDFHWFEDAVWRKDRIMAVEQHFITAFLDRYVKGDAEAAAYLDTDTPVGADGRWTGGAGYADRSPGGSGATWKGFFRNSAVGLELRRAAPIK